MFYTISKAAWFIATPSNLLPLIALVGLLGALFTRFRRLGLGVALLGLLGVFATGLAPLANWLILPLEQRFPPYREDGRSVAGVVVLGGALQAEESFARGQMTVNEAAERVIALADLARRHPQARIVFSGGGGTIFGDEVAEAEGLRRFGDALGLAPERVTYEDRSLTSAENARLTRQLVEPKDGERWLLVTSAWHMPRAVGCFRQAGFPVTAYPVDFRTRGPGDAGRFFAFVSEGQRRFDLAAKEWAGLVAYRLTGRTDALFPGP